MAQLLGGLRLPSLRSLVLERSGFGEFPLISLVYLSNIGVVEFLALCAEAFPNLERLIVQV